MTDVRKLDLNLVVVLDVLLSERNLTRTGERTGMTQSAVSGALRRLREIFDDPLLERQGRGFVLTARAESLAPMVAQCLADVRQTFEVVPEFIPEQSTRTFMVSASDYVLSELTGPLLAVLRETAPQTRVEFSALPSEALVSPVDLLRRDVIIAATGRGVPGKRASLFLDRFVCLVDAANPALRDGRLSQAAITRLRQVRSVFGPSTSTHVDDMLSQANLAPSVALTVQGFLPIPFAIAGTEWLGWVPERTALRYAAHLGLVIAQTPIEPAVLIEAAHWHPSKSADPALQWLVASLRRAAELVEFGTEDVVAR